MKIGIAINGEGRGHFSRARALAEVLAERHEVSFWVPSHLSGELTGYFPTAKIHSIPCLRFVQKGFSIRYLKTISINAGKVLFPYYIHAQIARDLRDSGIDAIISDFEPFTSKAAKIIGIPVLQLNHPGVVVRSFSLNPAALISQIVALYMMQNSDRRIFCSFFDGDVGPIVRSELRTKSVSRGDYYVVYQKSLYAEILSPILSAVGRKHFKVFPHPKADYAEALAGCRGLIAPAGHQSISEALALGKPVLAIPVKGQYEQELNARKLRTSGFGDFAHAEKLPTALPAFIASIETYEHALAMRNLVGEKLTKRGWSCADETIRAVGMIENFLLDSKIHPEWKRKAFFAPALLELR